MHEIRWEWCPRVAAHELTRQFLLSQARLQKARQTLEAYARDLDDLLEAFADLPFDEVIEADSGQLELYLDGLYNRPPKHGAGSQTKITRITNTRLALATIRRRVGTARRFYQWLIDRRLRRDVINPVPRGIKGVSRGPVPSPRQDPWIPGDDAWERILRHFLEQESLRNQVLLLVCYDGALRRQECLRLRVEDIDHQSLTIKVRAETTKNGKERFVVLSPITYQKLQHYLARDRRRLIEDYGGEEDGCIFVSESLRLDLSGCHQKGAEACWDTGTDAPQIAPFDAHRPGSRRHGAFRSELLRRPCLTGDHEPLCASAALNRGAPRSQGHPMAG